MIHSSSVHSYQLHTNKEQEYLDGWKRSRAELKRVKSRMEEEFEAQKKQAKVQAVESLLELADNFQSLVRHVPSEMRDDPWAQGVVHVARQFEQVLEDSGLQPIGSVDEAFDPRVHEAIEQIEDADRTSGSVTEVMQTGYRVGDIIIRPAKVKVVK